MNHKYMALDVAFYIIGYCNDNNINIYNLNLQKILYYAQGNYLAEYDMVLFKDEIFAFEYGPTVYNVYRYFAPYGSNTLNPNKTFEGLKELDKDTKLWLNNIIDNKTKVSSWRLANETKSEDPWLKTTNNGKNLNRIIEHSVMREYFKSIR